MSQTLVEIENLAVGYGRKVILDAINIAISRNAFLGLLGSNGSGKTTLLKTIAGIIPPLGGRIRFASGDDGKVVIGYVPQKESLDPIYMLSSFEVVLMGVCGRVGPGRLIGSGEKDWARHCMEQTGSTSFARRPFSHLSGGQKQRVLIARALAAKPNLLLLDEPTAGVDAAATASIIEVLKQLHASGLAIVMVNHDLGAIKKSVQQVAWVHEGRIEQGSASMMLSRDNLERLMEIA